MNKHVMDDVVDPVDVLREAAEAAGSVRELARQMEISPSFLGDCLHERRPIPPSVLDALGLERVVRRKREG